MRFFWDKGAESGEPIALKTNDNSMNIWSSDKKLKRLLSIRRIETMGERLPRIKRATNESNVSFICVTFEWKQKIRINKIILWDQVNFKRCLLSPTLSSQSQNYQ